MQINITVRNQSIIDICPCVVLAEDSQNYVTAVFTFLTDDWDNTEKTAQFQNPKTGEVYESILDSSNACTVRWEALADNGDMNVAVFGVNGGYRVTTNMGVITVLPTLSGGESDTPPSPDVYQQLLTMLGQKADNMTYSDSVLKLLSGTKELARVIIAGGGSNIQPDWNQNDSGAADYIKNRPFYENETVLAEWDGNTEGLVAATDSDGHIIAYKILGGALPGIQEFNVAVISDGTVVETTTKLDNTFFATISSDDPEITGAVGYTVYKDNYEGSEGTFPEAGLYALYFREDKYTARFIDSGIVKLPNKYLNLDAELNEDSENPVQNKAVAAATAKVPLMVRMYLGQGVSFSESYDTISQALENERPVIGIVDYSGGRDLVLPYWNKGTNTVYFDISSGNASWKYAIIGRDRYGYNVTEYAADLPALTPGGRETNAGCVIIVGSTGTKYQLKKLNATDIGALSGTIASSWADVPELLVNYDTVLYNTASGNPPEGLREPALIVAGVTEGGTRQLSILDGYGQIWTGSVNLSSGTITVKKVDTGGIKKLDNGSNMFSPWEHEDGIYEITNASNTFFVNGITGDESDPTVSISSAVTLDNNVFYASISTGSYTQTGITKMVTFTLIDNVNAYQWVYTLKNGIWSTAKSNVMDVIGEEALAKDNTTEYTPTGDYNPATKKYVDDAVGDVSAATPRQQMTAEDTTVALQPNTLYVFPEMATLSVTLATPANTAVANEYHFFFTSGATATTMTLPEDVVTAGQAIEANKKYEVSILESIAYIQGVSISGT